ncbi:MAG: hypothetical protein KJP09_06675 [Bacteroidia bacterium]|nr:hypothetical protein [Bacteroidia bacterium]MBT8308749.1 hypothetical protein [Bacteroidia bacterium]NND10666.1 hypothetical protein [Flavobacteriaceae bacterium]NNL59901.1 hypothetical protein [Flavobacteriaceae bacterium]
MKIPVMFYIFFTTMLLILITIFVSMDMPFNVVFYLTCFGQLMVCVMVYKVLRDNYKTDKTFKDFYEDFPISDT